MQQPLIEELGLGRDSGSESVPAHASATVDELIEELGLDSGSEVESRAASRISTPESDALEAALSQLADSDASSVSGGSTVSGTESSEAGESDVSEWEPPSRASRADHHSYIPDHAPDFDETFCGEVSYSYPPDARIISPPIPEFRVSVEDGLATKVIAENVHSKKIGVARGSTYEHFQRTVSSLEDKAHCVPDQLMGSGYKKSYNIITASQYFNRHSQAAIEDTILGSVGNRPFRLEISIDYYSSPPTTPEIETLTGLLKDTGQLTNGELVKDDISHIKYSSGEQSKDLTPTEAQKIYDVLRAKGIVVAGEKIDLSPLTSDRDAIYRALEDVIPGDPDKKPEFFDQLEAQIIRCEHETTSSEIADMLKTGSRARRVKEMRYDVTTDTGSVGPLFTGPDIFLGIKPESIRRVRLGPRPVHLHAEV